MNEKAIFTPTEIEYYVGKLSYESFLFSDPGGQYYPNKNDFVLFDDNVYKVMYVMLDYDHNQLNVFLREATGEDF